MLRKAFFAATQGGRPHVSATDESKEAGVLSELLIMECRTQNSIQLSENNGTVNKRGAISSTKR